jgi:hypothetical protein
LPFDGVSAQSTATDSDSEDEKKKTKAEMIANMNQQLWVPLIGGTTAFTADSDHGPLLHGGGNDQEPNDLAKNGHGRPRSVPAKRDEHVERGKLAWKILL